MGLRWARQTSGPLVFTPCAIRVTSRSEVAAAVAAGMAVATLGSDTGGSIPPARFVLRRRGADAHLRRRVSRYGLIAFASSLDHIGPLTRTVKDAAIVLGAIAGRDPMDSTSAEVPVPDYVSQLERPVRGLKLGVAKEILRRRLVMRCARQSKRGFIFYKLKSLGCEVVSVSSCRTLLMRFLPTT